MRGKGFTLIELLVTISILSILMTIALISYGNIQRGARDARRKSDISNIRSALEQYHADQGFYPLPSTSCTDGSLFGGCPLKSPTATKTYMSTVPQEAQSGWPVYSYFATPNSPQCSNADSTTYCTNYCLYATVENDSSAVAALPTCPGGSSQYQTQAP